MVRPHIASAMFVLTREALQPYIRPLDCRVLSLRARWIPRRGVLITISAVTIVCACVSFRFPPRQSCLVCHHVHVAAQCLKRLPSAVCCLVHLVIPCPAALASAQAVCSTWSAGSPPLWPTTHRRCAPCGWPTPPPPHSDVGRAATASTQRLRGSVFLLDTRNTARAPCISKPPRRHPPRLLIPNNCSRPPVECWRGTSPNQAPTPVHCETSSRPPPAANNAVAVMGQSPVCPSTAAPVHPPWPSVQSSPPTPPAARPCAPASHRHPVVTHGNPRSTRSRHPPVCPATPPYPARPCPISIPCSANNPRTWFTSRRALRHRQ